jgi:hydroxyethylthiazole kinase-like uncharacterized protein yjeF
MKLVTVDQMRNLDAAAIRDFGISGLILMENAGRAVADTIVHFLGGVVSRRILIFSGKGNNGGDGFVVARHLANRGADVKVFLISPKEEIQGDALVNLEILEKSGISISALGPRDIQKVKISLLYADLAVDAIYGTGFKGKVTGIASRVIEAINSSGKPVVSVDLPSGLEADTGRVEGPCIRASLTCTLGLPKLGFFLYPGVEYCGDIRVMDISLPTALTTGETLFYNLIDEELCRPMFGSRPKDSHKGTFGQVLVAGGSPGMTGAVALAAEAALKSGAGLVKACVPASLNPVLENKLTEVITVPLPESENQLLGTDAAGVLVEKAGKDGVIAVGPGLSIGEAVENFVGELFAKAQSPLVVDADGLNAAAGNPDVFLELNVPAVITPHPGEMARLMGITSSEVQQDRIGVAGEFAARYGLVVVLKGAGTIVAAPGGKIFINSTGNPGMATAGSGDVLTGLIASFMAQGFSPVQAAVAGVYIHGAAGDAVAVSVGERGMVAGDLLRGVPKTIAKLEKLTLER